jgi:hypothetical protein
LGFGLYIISCIIMRDTSQKVYHGLAAIMHHVRSLYILSKQKFLAYSCVHTIADGRISFLAKNREAHLVKNYEGEGIGMPPKIRIKSTTTIIPAIIKGIRKRKIARTTTAMIAIINKVSVDP